MKKLVAVASLLTGEWADEVTGDREKWLASGMDAGVSKPVHPTEPQAPRQRSAEESEAEAVPSRRTRPARQAP